MIYRDILEATGHTPLIRLNKMVTDQMAQVLIKFEGLNVGGSIKTRTALNMIKAGEDGGIIKPDTIIVEPTSGNQGIGLALIGAVRGYRTIIIMPDSVSEERRKLITHYGAELKLVHDCGNIGDCIECCLKTALDMAKDDPRIFVPQQFSNPANPRVHMEQTALEILEDAGDIKIDGFTSGVGTGGTLSGVGKMLRKHNPEVIIWAVEPEHAAILAGGNIGTHLQMGIGDGLIPDNLDMTIFNDICVITDSDAIATAQNLAKSEGLMCGISSGTNVAAALRMAAILGPGKTVVTILPDTAERYFSTPLFANI